MQDTSAISAIDQVIGCQQCGASLEGSPSDDFCCEDCQDTWHLARPGTVQPAGGTAAPDEALPETTPVRPLGWLGPPPPGAVVRAGHEVLDGVCAFVSRFSAFPSEHCAPTLALWYAHTHAVDQFYVTPRLILDSAEPGSGKTRVLEVAQYLVAAPEMTISATTAALFRLVSMGPITILFDEVDALFNQAGGANEDLRGLLNAGYKRSATIARCVGDTKTMKVQRFPVYAPAALAGIAGAMPATITTRAITIHMRRRRADEPVEPFRERQVAREAQPIREELTGWIDSTGSRLADAQPEMPDAVTDRPAEIWEPLLAIADTAGGHWPQTARGACRHFVLHAGPQITSPGVRLLADLRHVFTAHRTDRMTTAEILAALIELEEAPWAELHGKPLDARRLGRELGKYGVRSKDIKLDGRAIKGYRADGDDGLADAWSRYLPTAATAATTRDRAGHSGPHGRGYQPGRGYNRDPPNGRDPPEQPGRGSRGSRGYQRRPPAHPRTGRTPPVSTDQPTPVPAPRPRTSTRLTIPDICADLDISRSTFYEWRAKGRGPHCIKLPNGDIRVNRAEYERWLTTLEEVAS